MYSVPCPESVNVEIYKKDKKGKITNRRLIPIESVSSSLKIPDALRNRWSLPKALNVVTIHVDLGFAYQRVISVRLNLTRCYNIDMLDTIRPITTSSFS